jgi:glycosyltransferase involved in cell wall biosynthesis
MNNFKLLKKPISIAKQTWDKKIKPEVTIICSTYNHELYIKKTIESFLMQETTFPVEIIIHDDASLDKNVNLIKQYKIQYPKIIKTIFRKRNLNSQNIRASINLYYRAQGKYIALCEGDDFWTSKYKLQKQYEALQKNSNYIFCGHLTEKFVDLKMNKPKVITIDSLIKNKFICHTSSFFFKNIFKKINKVDLPEYLFYGFNFDYALAAFLMNQSDCIVLPFKMSVYRINGKGMFSSLKSNSGLIKKAQSMLNINLQMKFYFGPKIYLILSKKNLHFQLSIIKRNLLSLNFFGLIKGVSFFWFLIFEYISASILLYSQKKNKKNLNND